jgi:ATP-dependent DNA helicase DinG
MVRLGGDDSAPGSKASEDAASIARRAEELADNLRFLLAASDSSFVYFLETRGRGVFLRAAPIDVSRLVREFLSIRMHATVLTSATLTVEGSFAYVKGRLGLDHALEVRVPSEFDFAEQSVLYLPQRMPSPKSPDYGSAVAREVLELLSCSRGRAFVLFTSYAMLRTVRDLIALELSYPASRSRNRAAQRAVESVPRHTKRGTYWRPPRSGRAWTSWASS